MLLPNIQLIEIKEKIANNKKYEKIDKMCFSIKPFTPPNFPSFVKIILSDIFAVSKEKVYVLFFQLPHVSVACCCIACPLSESFGMCNAHHNKKLRMIQIIIMCDANPLL